MMFYSTKVEAAWRKAGEPYCEHPSFARDASKLGKDHTDWYCSSCGVIWVNKWPDSKPEPRGSH